MARWEHCDRRTGAPAVTSQAIRPPLNPVIPAAGLSSTVTVYLVDYVAQWAGYDTEECIEKALADGVIELEYKSDWRRDHDVYRLTPKGLAQSGKHTRDVFERSARMARRDYEEDMRKRARAAGAAATGPGRPPPLAAGELILPICQFRGNCRRRPFCLVVGSAAEPAEPRAHTCPPRAAGSASPACRMRPSISSCAGGCRPRAEHSPPCQGRPPAYFSGGRGAGGGAPHAGCPAGVRRRRGPARAVQDAPYIQSLDSCVAGMAGAVARVAVGAGDRGYGNAVPGGVGVELRL